MDIFYDSKKKTYILGDTPYSKDEFVAYIESDMLQSALATSVVTLDIETTASQLPKETDALPRNIIYFGAPGTGKSHALESDRALHFSNGNYERVTFYPNYSYAQFVGTYKPVMDGRNIKYSYVPGPFLRTWIKAMQDKAVPQLLIVEELNRANAPAVFGDVFQLLDRSGGTSKYCITTSEDLRNYLQSLPPSKPENGSWEWLPENIDTSTMVIPNNMFIWTTMNSADQGVFPLDTAFKRRWSYKYFGINHKEWKNEHVVSIGDKKYLWNSIRHAINRKLISLKVNEDKQIGPFFLDKSDFDDFVSVFKNKVIMYLYEDAAKLKHGFFKSDTQTYSELCCDFSDGKGFDIFNCDINPATADEIDAFLKSEESKN